MFASILEGLILCSLAFYAAYRSTPGKRVIAGTSLLILLAAVGVFVAVGSYAIRLHRYDQPQTVLVSTQPYNWKKGTAVPGTSNFVNPEFGTWTSGEGTAVTIRVGKSDLTKFKPGCVVPLLMSSDSIQISDLVAPVLDVRGDQVTLLLDSRAPVSDVITAFHQRSVTLPGCTSLGV